MRIKWLIVNNALREDTFDEIIKNNDGLLSIINGPINNFEGPKAVSKHHAAGLDLIVPQVKTRFVLILDPDFYIIMPNWAESIIKYMNQYNISLFGVPWHPRWTTKYRYFPCIHCLFVDTRNVDLSSLSFMPEFENIDSSAMWRTFLSKVPLLRSRAYVGCSRDTGYRIYKNYLNSSIRWELAVPSFSITDLYKKYYRYPRTFVDLWFFLNKALDKIFPESMSVSPPQKGYFTERCFSELGYPDCKSFGWEEFFWNNKPFGFHIRGFQQKKGESQDDMERIKDVLQVFVNKSTKDTLNYKEERLNRDLLLLSKCSRNRENATGDLVDFNLT